MLRQLAMIALLVASATSVPVDFLPGQSPSPPAQGQRVRINLTTGELPAEGWMAGWVADTLLLRRLVYRGAPDSLRHIPRADIASYQASLGRDEGRGLARGAKAGALIGGSIGVVLLLLGLAADAGCGDGDYCFGTLFGAVFGAGATLGGTALGSVIGLLTAPERWSESRALASREYRSPSTRMALGLSIKP